MARVKRGVVAKARHKKILKLTKGYRHGRKNIYRLAKQATLKAESNRFIGRKQKKRAMRSLWIIRINAACKQNGIKYSRLVEYMNKNKQELNRKTLSDLARNKPEEFKMLAEKVTEKQT